MTHVIDVDAKIGTLTARALDQPREDRTRPPESAFRLCDCADLLTAAPFSRIGEVRRDRTARCTPLRAVCRPTWTVSAPGSTPSCQGDQDRNPPVAARNEGCTNSQAPAPHASGAIGARVIAPTEGYAGVRPVSRGCRWSDVSGGCQVHEGPHRGTRSERSCSEVRSPPSEGGKRCGPRPSSAVSAGVCATRRCGRGRASVRRRRCRSRRGRPQARR